MNAVLRLLTLCALALPLAAQAVYLPSAPAIEAKSYLLIDANSGQVLAEHNADERVEPASLTKMMTAYVVFNELHDGRIHLDDMVRVSKHAYEMGGSRMFIELGSKVPLKRLLDGMLTASGNDAAVALAEYVAGGEDTFVQIMQQYAGKLGMTNTHFMDATGMPNKDHYSTARDLSKLAIAIIHQFPEYYPMFKDKVITYNNITQYNRNKLLWRENSVDGLKTGHTESAGYCLVASAKQGEMRLVSVVMGTKSEDARATESQKLIDYGFRFYETHRLYDAQKPLKALRIWKGKVDQVQLGLANDLFVTVPRGEYGKLKASLSVDKVITAPVDAGQALGKVNITLDGAPVAERPLVALNGVAQGSLVDRMVDSVLMLVQ